MSLADLYAHLEDLRCPWCSVNSGTILEDSEHPYVKIHCDGCFNHYAIWINE